MLVEKLRSCCQQYLAIFSDGNFLLGFSVGAAVLLLLFLLFWLVLSRRRRCSALVMEEEGGQFVLSISTLRTFMRHIVLEFPRTELKNLSIRKKSDGVTLKMHLLVFPDTDIIAIRNKMRERILADAESKFGISGKIQGIDIKIDKMIDDEDSAGESLRAEPRHSAPAKSSAPVPPLPPVK